MADDRTRSWVSGLLRGVPVTGPPAEDNVVPLRQQTLDEMMTELRAYDAALLDKRLGIDRADRAYVQERNDAARAFNELRKRTIAARARVAEHLKTFGMRVEWPTTPAEVDIVGTSDPSPPLRQRPEQTGDDVN